MRDRIRSTSIFIEDYKFTQIATARILHVYIICIACVYRLYDTDRYRATKVHKSLGTSFFSNIFIIYNNDNK